MLLDVTAIDDAGDVSSERVREVDVSRKDDVEDLPAGDTGGLGLAVIEGKTTGP